MLDLSARRGKKTSHERPAAGVYSSIVVDVRWAEGYDEPEEAYEVIYEITSEQGKVYRHKEIFKNDISNKRTADFESYLFDHGIVDLKDFTGHHEQLTFAYQTVYDGKTYFNISARRWVS
jgi:hypothetical protein